MSTLSARQPNQTKKLAVLLLCAWVLLFVMPYFAQAEDTTLTGAQFLTWADARGIGYTMDGDYLSTLSLSTDYARAGLILLSNTDPSFYRDAVITLANPEIDLIGSITVELADPEDAEDYVNGLLSGGASAPLQKESASAPLREPESAYAISKDTEILPRAVLSPYRMLPDTRIVSSPYRIAPDTQPQALRPQPTQSAQSPYVIRPDAETKDAAPSPKRSLLSLSTASGSFTYQGLGRDGAAFAGSLCLDALASGDSISFTLDTSLFDTLSASAVLVEKVILNGNPAAPIFAGSVTPAVGIPPVWNLTLNGGAQTTGGLIGTLEENAAISVSLTLGDSLTGYASSAAHTGLFCNVMASGSALTVSGFTDSSASAPLTMTASGDSESAAGLLAGRMENGAQLTVANGAQLCPASVTVSGVYAGGLAGDAAAATITVGSGSIPLGTGYSVSGTAAEGGVFGRYRASGVNTPLSGGLSFASALRLRGVGVAGGFAGLIEADPTDSDVPKVTISSPARFALTNDRFCGGILGRLGNGTKPVFAELTDCTVTTDTPGIGGFCFGGAVAEIADGSTLRLNGFTLKTGGAIRGAGAVAYVRTGSTLCLAGAINLSEATYSDQSSAQLVGRRGNSLIYAEDGMTLQRGTGSSAYGLNDIANFGSVIRLGGDGALSEALFYIDSDNKVAVRFPAGFFNMLTGSGEIVVASADQLALLSCAIQHDWILGIAPTNGENGGLPTRSIRLTADIDMSHTGVYSLTRDDWERGSYPDYSGIFDGGGHTLTLRAGEAWGSGGGSIGDGRLVTGRKRLEDNTEYELHSNIAFLRGTRGATIRNLTIAGTTNYNVGAGAKVGVLVAYANNNLTFNNVTVQTDVNLQRMSNTQNSFGFLVGCGEGGNGTLTVTGCEIAREASLTIAQCYYNCRFGGLAGNCSNADNNGFRYVTIANTAINCGFDCTSANNGGLCGGMTMGYMSHNTGTITINGLSFTGAQLDLRAVGNESGGLLGRTWRVKSVTFGSPGVTVGADQAAEAPAIPTSIHTHESNTRLGGLCYEASGHWLVPENGIQFDSLSITAMDGDLGLLVNQGTELYLELRHVNSYRLGSDGNGAGIAITKSQNRRFDELVYQTAKNWNVFNNGSGIISIATENHALIDQTSRNTYRNKTTYNNTGTAWNGHHYSRYYYNLDQYRTGSTDRAAQLLIWSVRQYAAANLTEYFTAYSGWNTAGAVDLSGYSYYPVSVSDVTLASGLSIRFQNAEIETMENMNQKGTRKPSEQNQHYMMHGGLLYDVGSLTVPNLTLSGSVGKRIENKSGALVCGTIAGTDAEHKGRLELGGLCLNDVYIVGANDSCGLLVNEIGSYVDADVTGVRTASAESTGLYALRTAANDSWHAAGSLIGSVGSETAEGISLKFGSALDSMPAPSAAERMAAGVSLDSRISRSARDETYGTSRSIFSKATLIGLLRYNGSSSGVYQYSVSNEPYVTYGKEVTVSVRNPDQQTKYYDSDDTQTSWRNQGSDTNFGSSYRPYVGNSENSSNKTHELDVNLMPLELLVGCGSYGDPYVLDEALDLQLLADYLAGGPAGAKWSLQYPNNELDVVGAENHETYTYDGTVWRSGPQSISDADMRAYLRRACYRIADHAEITLGAKYPGLGTAAAPFHGVLVGGTGSRITLSQQPLVLYANGCVLRDVTLRAGESVALHAATKPTFGFAIGAVSGGDNVLDGVQLSAAAAALTIADQNLPVGGLVGTVSAGGVLLRRQGGGDGVASAMSALTGGRSNSAAPPYCNPYVGRVLDGYVLSEDCDVDNTDHNYKIPRIGSPTLAYDGNTGTLTVHSAEDLYLVSALINSAAGYGEDCFGRGACDYASVGSAPRPSAAAGDAANRQVLLQRCGIALDALPDAVSIVLADDANLSGFGTGFRGLGRRYGADTVTVSELDGGGHTVTLNMVLEEPESESQRAQAVGLCNVFSGAMQSLTVAGTVNSNGRSAPVGAAVGCLVGGSLDEVCGSGLSVTGYYSAGGLVGNQEMGTTSTMTGCSVQIRSVFGNNAGGLVGSADGELSVSDASVSFSGLSPQITSVSYADSPGRCGGILGFANGPVISGVRTGSLAIERATVSGGSIQSDANNAGVGGIVGVVGCNATLTDCLVGGPDAESDAVAIRSREWFSGGFAGTLSAGTLTLEGCCLQNAVVGTKGAALGGSVGGVVGCVPGNAANGTALHIRDLLLADSVLHARWHAGGLLGVNDQGQRLRIYASDVLFRSLRVLSDNYTDTTGLLVSHDNQAGIQVAALSVQGLDSELPDREVNDGALSGYVLYADYSGSSSGSGSVSASPVSALSVVGMTGALCGDAAAMYNASTTLPAYLYHQATAAPQITDDGHRSYRSALKAELDAAAGVAAGEYPFVSFRQAKSTAEPPDFPVLIVNKNKNLEIDRLVTAYLDLLTNGGWSDYIAYAEAAAPVVTLQSYRWTDSTFQPIPDEQTLSYVGGSFRAGTATDDDGLRFTLLTILIPDPAGGTPFLLYVPVLVERPVQIGFRATLVNGSQFREDLVNGTETVTIESGGRATLLLDYRYDHNWGDLLLADAAQTRLSWRFDKTFELGDSLVASSVLPAGTVLTLVDLQDGSRSHTATLSEATRLPNLSTLFPQSFAARPIRDLMAMEPIPDGAETEDRWESCEASDPGAVLLNGQAYRRAENGTLRITVGERYYLLLQLPDNPERSFYLVRFEPPTELDGAGALPNEITLESAPSLMVYRSLRLSALRQNDQLNGVEKSSGTYQHVADGNNTITVRTQIGIQGPSAILSDRTHRYLRLELRRQDHTDGGSSAARFPATQVSARFYADDHTPLGAAYEVLLPAGTATLTIPLMENAVQWLDVAQRMTDVGQDESGVQQKAVTIYAEVDMTFLQEDLPEAFAEAGQLNGDLPSQYTFYDCIVSMSEDPGFQTGVLAESTSPGANYYRREALQPVMTFDANASASLGVNPASPDERPDGRSRIDATAVVNFEGMQQRLQSYGDMTCTLTLTRKGDSGSYEAIDDAAAYLQSMTLLDRAAAANGNTAWSLSIPRGEDDSYGGAYDPATRRLSLPVSFEVLRNVSSYANYKLELTISFDVGGDSVQLTDHIIYTYARIPTELLDLRHAAAQPESP